MKALSLEQKVRFLTGSTWWTTHSFSEAGIESVFVSDGPHGLRTQKESADHLGINKSLPSTCFPCESLTANSFNRDLLYSIGRQIAMEAVAYDVDVVLGPGVNIKRSPLCGRNFEYFSEDPVLSGELASAFINGVQSVGVGACVKHFALNNTENKRFLSDSICDEQTMREIYLKPFEIAVKKSRPMAIMTAYNKVNGCYASQNNWLLTKVLRNEWGFDGVAISDWGAVSSLAKSVKAGLNLEMPPSYGMGYASVMSALQSGEILESDIDRAVEGLIAFASRAKENRSKKRCTTTMEESHRVAENASVESMVLLKNNNGVLPLSKGERVLVLGRVAKHPQFQGGGSSHINPSKVVSLLDGLTEQGISYTYLDSVEEAARVASSYSTVVFAVSLSSKDESEGYDRDSLNLSSEMNQMVTSVAPLCKKSVALICTGGTVVLNWLDMVDAVMYCGLSGQAGGTAMARLLVGETSPSGKLAETWASDISQTPTYHCPPLGTEVHYAERQFVGYRWYLARNITPQFYFGQGLSYTTFALSNPSYNSNNGTVSVTVTNTGNVRGAETVMLFTSCLCSPSARPRRELANFSKVWLNAGQSAEVVLECENCFLSHSGEYLLELGTSVNNIVFSQSVTHVDYVAPFTVDSSLAQLFSNPASATMLAGIFAKRRADEAKKAQQGTSTQNQEQGEDDFSTMVQRMAADFPLRALGVFMPEYFTAEVIEQILAVAGGNDDI